MKRATLPAFIAMTAIILVGSSNLFSQDELPYYLKDRGRRVPTSSIADIQLHIFPNAFIRINNAFGMTSKATDYAPEVGILFHF